MALCDKGGKVRIMCIVVLSTPTTRYTDGASEREAAALYSVSSYMGDQVPSMWPSSVSVTLRMPLD
eukprot:3304736-Pleurochrysis_carterae.AAC.1